jgi:hypothetical protein
MFGSQILDVAIGMAFIYLLLSLICSAVSEIIEAWLKKRATDLEKGIRELLRDYKGDGVVKEIYRHPLVSGLFRGDYEPTEDLAPAYGLRNMWQWVARRAHTPEAWHDLPAEFIRKRAYRVRGFLLNRGGPDLPSYIPSRNFALALMDIVMRDQQPGAASPPAGGHATAYTLADLRRALAENPNLPSAEINRALLSLVDTIHGDLDTARESIERWFDSSMDRVSGWYKRRTQVIILLIGLGAAVVVNVDTIAVFKSLMNDPPLRASLVAAAQEYAKSNPPSPAPSAPPAAAPSPSPSPEPSSSPAPAGGSQTEACRRDEDSPECRVQRNLKQLEGLGLPVGWNCQDRRALPQCVQFSVYPSKWNLGGITWRSWLAKLFGWLLTAAAVSLGAPFWFDLLNKFMVVRSTVKPHEKSPEEKPVD